MRRQKMMSYIILCLIVSLILCGCSTKSGNPQEQTITIGAAASLASVLDEIAEVYEQEHDGVEIIISYGSSGSLQKQIEQGAPIDLFLSASTQQVDRLQEKKLLVESSITPWLTNRLVVVTSDKQHIDVEVGTNALGQLFLSLNPTYIALGEVETVPAGIYAKQVLDQEHIWDDWKHTYVYGKDVREVLSFVEQGNADLGIIYASDAMSSQKVKVIYDIPTSQHEPILYVGSVIGTTQNEALAHAFLKYMQHEKWIALYESNGFKRMD